VAEGQGAELGHAGSADVSASTAVLPEGVAADARTRPATGAFRGVPRAYFEEAAQIGRAVFASGAGLERVYGLGGLRCHVRYADRAAEAAVHRALAHVEISPGGPADLTIGVCVLPGFGDTILPTGCSLAESIADTINDCSTPPATGLPSERRSRVDRASAAWSSGPRAVGVAASRYTPPLARAVHCRARRPAAFTSTPITSTLREAAVAVWHAEGGGAQLPGPPATSTTVRSPAAGRSLAARATPSESGAAPTGFTPLSAARIALESAALTGTVPRLSEHEPLPPP